MNEGETGSLWECITLHCQECMLLIFIPAFPIGIYSLLLGWLYIADKEIIRNFRDYWTVAEFTLALGDPKHHWGLLVRVRTCKSQVIYRILDQVHLTVGPLNHPVVISPVPECILEIEIFRNWQNPHMWFLTCGVRANMGGKGKVEATRAAYTYENSTS